MLKEFKDFLLRGNIVELAVAFVMGVAFAAVVNSLVDNLVMPVIAMIIGKPDFSGLTFTINDAVFRYGAFITDVIQFVAIAAAVFFFIVKPVQAMMARAQRARRGRHAGRGAPAPGAARGAAGPEHVQPAPPQASNPRAWRGGSTRPRRMWIKGGSCCRVRRSCGERLRVRSRRCRPSRRSGRAAVPRHGRNLGCPWRLHRRPVRALQDACGAGTDDLRRPRRRLRLNERYVREWLEQQTAAAILEVDDARADNCA